MNALQYLSWHFVKDYQTAITILQNVLADELASQKLINIQSRSGLTAVTRDCRQTFLRTKEKFGSKTKIVNHFKKIDRLSMTVRDLSIDYRKTQYCL